MYIYIYHIYIYDVFSDIQTDHSRINETVHELLCHYGKKSFYDEHDIGT